MREIKFRGLNGKEWIYGMPTYDFKYVFGEDNLDSPDRYEVDPKTVGQFTGLKDKNGVDIYEGDIILPDYNGLLEFEVEYTNGKFNICGYSIDNLIVTGNIHQKK